MNFRPHFRRLAEQLSALVRDDRGQALSVVAAMLTVLLAFCALALDLGRARYTYRELQATSDASALAAARAVPTATSAGAITGATGVAAAYSAAPGGANQRASLPSVTVTSRLECLASLQAQGIACVGSVPYNAVQVTETMTLPMYFAGILGHRTIPISTTSTASTRGGSPLPANIAILVDSTLSMNAYDADCGATQMTCATNGVQTLLLALNPCGLYQVACARNGAVTGSFDRVSLFTFPNVTVGTSGIDSSCTTPIPAPNGSNGYVAYPPYGNITMLPTSPWGGVPTSVAYSFPAVGAASYSPSGSTSPTYQLLNYLADYSLSDSSTSLNTASPMVMAAGGVSGCGGMLPPNYAGEWGTYYAGAIYAAQASLVAEQAANPGSQNVLILLGDGDSNAKQTNNGYTVMGSPATANGLYPSWVGECGQAVVAADYATSVGTTVYTVAYGSPPTGCTTDVSAGSYPNISPCNAMANMASASQYFYSDYKQTGSGSTCYASQPFTSLNQIFASIAAGISSARLIPNDTA